MSRHGHREAAWQLDAILWHDRVYADVHSEQGRAAARQHHVSPWLIGQAAALIARYIARGEDVVSLADADRQLAALRALAAPRVEALPIGIFHCKVHRFLELARVEREFGW